MPPSVSRRRMQQALVELREVLVDALALVDRVEEEVAQAGDA